MNNETDTLRHSFLKIPNGRMRFLRILMVLFSNLYTYQALSLWSHPNHSTYKAFYKLERQKEYKTQGTMPHKNMNLPYSTVV